MELLWLDAIVGGGPVAPLDAYHIFVIKVIP
jgi:hypothetical protein